MRKLWNITRWFARHRRTDVELNAELLFHLDAQTDLNLARGMAPEEARRTAMLQLGGLEATKEECREVRSGRALEATLQDLRYGLRVLAKNPGFTAAAVLILALGIGANTAMFSLVYGVLLRPLPYASGGQLVVLHQTASRAGVSDIPFSVKEIDDYRTQNQTLGSVVEHHSMVFLLLDKDSAERVQTGVVSANFFDVLGVKPLLGRSFVAADEAHGADAVLILSHDYWVKRFGNDPNIVGRVFQMNNRPHTVIGVLPPIPQYPVSSDVYMPTSQCPTRSSEQFQANRQARMMTVFGRLKPGVPLAQAQADLSTVAGRLEAVYPEVYPKAYGYGIRAETLREDLTRGAKPALLILLGASVLVLLIACANVANLLLARLVKLERELMIRAALGASKSRLVRHLMAQSVPLALLGGAAGLALTPFAMSALVRFVARYTTRAAEVRVDAPVLLFTLGASLLTGILFGVAPALRFRHLSAESLHVGRGTPGQARQRLRAVLVMAQVATSFALLIGAGLMFRSLTRLLNQDAGLSTDRLLAMRITPNFTRYNDGAKLGRLAEAVLDASRSTGDVESVSLASNFPFSRRGVAMGPGDSEFSIEGRPTSKGELSPRVDLTLVSEDYFQTIRQGVIAGRSFTAHDDNEAPRVAVINQAMARHRWPESDAVGKRVSFDRGKSWITVVGVVADVREYGLDRAPGDELYLPMRQRGFAANLVLRTAHDPAAVIAAVRARLHDLDPHLAVDEVATLDRLRAESTASPRLIALLLGLFAVLALVICASGIAAVMALWVTQRSQELGIRMALGASREELVFSVVGLGVRMALGGTLVGIGAALLLTRWLSSLLYETSPTDPLTFAAVSLIFLAVAVVASFLPARQVTAIDPMTALRMD